MKRCFLLLICLVLTFSMISPVCASEYSNNTGTVLFCSEEQLDNGLTVTREVVEYAQTRTTYGKTAVYKDTFKDGDTVIAIIAFEATFHYDGTSVSVASKRITQIDTYSGWSFKQSSFTSSGGSVTLAGKLTKWLIFNTSSFTMVLTCDKNGNVSYA